MKIGAGSLRGRILEVADGVRPTSGRSKEALFSRWQATLDGCLFLDLFAGSGGVGLEAVSRGAAEAVLVERDRAALKTLERNCAKLAPQRCSVICDRLPKLTRAVSSRAPFDHVFADPPYEFEDYERLLRAVSGVLSPEGEAAIEHSRRVELPAPPSPLVRVERRRYGDSALTFYSRPDRGGG